MILRNKTRRTILTKELTKAADIQKVRGLMGYSTPRSLLLKTHFGIHTFFLRFPIDILILDDTHTVVTMKKTLKPWKLYTWHPKYDIVIELPEGAIERSKTEIGDCLYFS